MTHILCPYHYKMWSGSTTRKCVLARPDEECEICRYEDENPESTKPEGYGS